MSQSFDTGNNDPRRQGVLRESLDHLLELDFDFIRPVADTAGVYAYRVRYQGRGLYLVARRAQPFKVYDVEHISTQKALITIAAQQRTPILVSLWGEQDKSPKFTVFDAEELKHLYARDLLDQDHDNMRKGSRMLNYEWGLGHKLPDPRNIWTILDRIEMFKKEREKYGKVEKVHEDEPQQLRLEVTVDQDLIQCSSCGALYTSRLKECPGCGEPRDETKVRSEK